MISKRFFTRAMILGVILGLSACAGDGARTGAGTAFRNGDYLGAFRVLRDDLAAPGDARRRAMRQFDASPGGRARLVEAFAEEIRALERADQVTRLGAEVNIADTSGLLIGEQAKQLRDLLDLTLGKKIADGTIFMNLGDIDPPTLADARRRLVENTLRTIEASAPGSAGVRRPPVTALFQFLRGEGKDYRGVAEPILSQLNFSIRELKADVHTVFPGFAAQQLDALVLDVAIVASKRLLEVDIGEIITRRDELAVTEDEQHADAVVEIAELQYRERQIGPILRPVNITAQNITPLFRPANVPEGSSFAYDLVESTFDVEWVYEARFVRGGDVFANDVVRGVDTRTDHQCHNGRYVTPSGQQIISSDWPTADVSLSCRGSGPPAAAGLQPAIMEKLGEQVLKRLITLEP